MAEQTLILTTGVGLRPLGVRGEPLHATQAQIRAVLQRRLGARHAALLALSQPHERDSAIDWYADAEGEVRALSALDPVGRETASAEIDLLLQQAQRLGEELIASASSEAELLGRSLQLAARRPPDSFIFLVGDQPVMAAWGYEPDGLPPAFAAPSVPGSSVGRDHGSTPAAMAAAPAVAVPGSGLWRWLLPLALLLLLLLLGSGWLLRSCLPVEPEVALHHLPPLPAPAPPPAPPDPTPEKRATLASLKDSEAGLREQLAVLEQALVEKRAQCPPPKPPEPRSAAVPPAPPPAPPKPAEPPRKADLPEDRWKKGDVSILEGCWTLGRDSTTTMTTNRGTLRGTNRAGRICFDRNGTGTRQARAEFQGHPSVNCEAPIRVQFAPDGTLRTTQPQVTCDPRSVTWHSEPNYLTCQRVNDSVALCRDTQGFEHEFRREARR